MKYKTKGYVGVDRVDTTCENCGTLIKEARNNQKFCSRKCKQKHKRRHRPCPSDGKQKNRLLKGSYCKVCGPQIAYEFCQLDLDHIDGNNKNYHPDNLQTLCANCHRLKTFVNKDWEDKGR